jgi:signal transduction histidine kinase
VSLRIAGNRLQLTLEDNGIGLENAGTVGRGLQNMKRRASELGGVLDFASGNGARMILELPLRAQRQARVGVEQQHI